MKPRLLVVLGVAAVFLVLAMPPAGLVLGIVTIVLAVRALRATRPQPQELLKPDGTPVTVAVPQPGRVPTVIALALGVVSTTMAALLLVVLVAFWPQIRDFTRCQDQTNTTQGLEKCKTELKDAIFDRVGQ